MPGRPHPQTEKETAHERTSLVQTLIGFRNGREVARQSGALDLPGLLRWVESHV
jgi:hypothetical protein